MAPFCSCPGHCFLDFSLLSSPGVQSVFFVVAPRWAPRPFGGARAKKSITQGVFFCSGPVPVPNGLLLPLPFAGAGAKKQKPGWCFCFFCAGPGRNKKDTLHTRGRQQQKLKKPMTRGTSKKGPQKKKLLTHCGPGPRCSLTSFPGRLFRPGPAGVFFCCGPARTLTHSLRAWAAMPPAGVVFFFAAAPPGPGWCFVFLLWPRPDAHSLTHCGLGRFRQGPGGVSFFFFCCGPAEPGEPITKNVWCTTSGLKRPRGATAKKKNTTSEAPCNSRVYKD